MHTTLALRGLVVGLILVLAGCATNGAAEDDSTTSEHNAADVAFAQQMIQHHAQGLQLGDLTFGRELEPELAALTEAMREARGLEVETMAGWLRSWNEGIPATVRDHANSHAGEPPATGDEEDTGLDLPGMAGADDLEALERADDLEFPDLWLALMIEHHNGAIDMAQGQQAAGHYQPAISLAEEIEASQTSEVELMQDRLSR